jgi:hypothetical protein
MATCGLAHQAILGIQPDQMHLMLGAQISAFSKHGLFLSSRSFSKKTVVYTAGLGL